MLQNRAHRSGGIQLQLPAFSEENDAQRMVQLPIGQHDSLDGDVAHGFGNDAREAGELTTDIRRCVQQEPTYPVGTDSGCGLAARMSTARVGPTRAAVGAPAVPLRKRPTRRSTEKYDAQL
jgi:hypothetical protein